MYGPLPSVFPMRMSLPAPASRLILVKVTVVVVVTMPMSLLVPVPPVPGWRPVLVPLSSVPVAIVVVSAVPGPVAMAL